MALLLLAYLVGPMHRQGWRGVVTSVTGELAKVLRNQIEQIADTNNLPIRVLRSPTPGMVEGPNDCRLLFQAGDKASGVGIGADLAVVDELGLLPESRRELWNNIRACTSARDGRVIAISIMGDPNSFMAEVEEMKDDPAVVFHKYAADSGCRIDDPVQWDKANPGLAVGIKSMSYMHDTARAALANPADQSSFLAFDLNLPQNPARETIVSVSDWDSCEVEVSELPERRGPVVVGFDAGGSTSMTAAAALWCDTGRVEVWAAFPGTPDLLSRGQADGVGRLYERMESAGELRTYAGRVTPVADFIREMQDRLAGCRVVAVGADRFRKAETLQAMEQANVSWPMVWRGTGASSTADGSHDCRAFQRGVVSGRLRSAPSLLMMHAIAESSVTRDSGGNPKLDKARTRGRIDALQAAVIAAGLAELHNARPTPKYQSMVLS